MFFGFKDSFVEAQSYGFVKVLAMNIRSVYLEVFVEEMLNVIFYVKSKALILAKRTI